MKRAPRIPRGVRQRDTSDCLSQGSSARMSDRSTCGERSLATPKEPASLPESVPAVIGSVDSSSSSWLSIPELITRTDDGEENVTDDGSSASSPLVSQSFAQNVRAELESLSNKGDAADLSQ